MAWGKNNNYMSNMSYCRFENTANDLADCVDNMELDKDASEYEIRARKKLIALCKEVAENYDDEDEHI